MKRLVIFGVIFFLVSLVSACATTSGSSQGDLVKPGDKIGDFTITTGVEGKFIYGFDVECSEPGQDNSYTCNAKVGEAVNVSTGLYDTSGTGKLVEVWAKSNYQMFINDRPVDLASFGTIDYANQQVGMIRFANVVIIASHPGAIVVRDSGVFDNGDPFASTSTYIFSQP